MAHARPGPVPQPDAPASLDTMESLDALFRRIRDGDSDAFNELMTRFQERVKALTHQMLLGFPRVRREYGTSVVYSEWCLRIVKAMPKLAFEPPADFLGYAAMQIRWALLDLVEKAKPNILPAVGGPGSGPDPFSEKPDDMADDPETLAMWGEFHAAVDSTPEDDRRLFDLLFYQGISLKVTSAMLGVPLSTLKCRWQAARARLMLRLKNVLPV